MACSAARAPASGTVEREQPFGVELVAAHAPSEPASAQRTAPVLARGGQWMLVPERATPTEAIETGDGRRLLVVGGSRWIDHADGSIERARQVIVQEGVRALALPERLGKGYLFYADAGHSTLIWRADDWVADLTPLAVVEPPVRAIVPGFDRLYLTGQTSHALRALDPTTGAAKDLSPLPAAASYGGLAFAGARFGVVLADVRGALSTFDGGASWHPLTRALGVRALRAEGERVVLEAEEGSFELSATGLLNQTTPSGDDALFRDARTFMRYPQSAFERPERADAERSLLGGRPLALAVQRGVADGPDSAVVLHRGMLVRVRLTDGKVIALERDAHADVAPCRGIALGPGLGFVCGDGTRHTEVLRYANQQLTPLYRFEQPIRLRSSPDGGLVIGGACPGSLAPSRSSAARYCVRDAQGGLFELDVRGSRGRQRVAPLATGAAVLRVPRPNDPGQLALVSASGVRRVPLDLDGVPEERARLLRSGFWLDALMEADEGELRTWVVGAQSYVGVSVARDGRVRVGELEQGFDETSFFGPHGLHFAAGATLRETRDHGFGWRSSELGPAEIETLGAAMSSTLRGCSFVGCVYDDWLRVGYPPEDALPVAPEPERPKAVSHRPPGYAYWSLECAPTAISDDDARPRSPRAAARARDGVEGTWLPFRGFLPARPSIGGVRFDLGDAGEGGAFRAYAIGPDDNRWQRRGRWLLSVLDPFALDDPWATAWSESPWPDARVASRSFGLDPNVSVEWTLDLEAQGRTGALLLRASSDASVHLIEEGRPIQSLPARSLVELGAPVGAVKVLGTWYLGSFKNKTLTLYRVAEAGLERVGDYPVYADDGRVATRVIQSSAGDALAIWERSAAAGWFVFPIDLDSGRAGQATVVPLARLGRPPPACALDAAGWTMVSNVPLTSTGRSESNTTLTFSGVAKGLRTKALRARVIVTQAEICLEALAARTDGEWRTERRIEPTRPRQGAVHLTVSGDADAARFGFRCL